MRETKEEDNIKLRVVNDLETKYNILGEFYDTL